MSLGISLLAISILNEVYSYLPPLFSSIDLSMNFGEEKERLQLNVSQSLTRERIAELWPDYPKDAPTILSTPYPKSSKEAREANEKKRKNSDESNSILMDDFADYDKLT